MFGTLVTKELKAILHSPKFSVTFAVCALLILVSAYAGIQDYRAARAGWESALQLADSQAREAVSWRHFSYTVLRRPDPMAVFVSGLSNDIGRFSTIATDQAVKLRHSAYSDDPIFALFRMADFAFVVQIVLSLLAILFTYDAVSGERESGTLKLIFANGVSRATYLAAKCLGAWLALVVPILIPILLALLMVVGFGVPFGPSEWARVAALIGVSLMYFTLFVVLGVFISTLTQRSSVSFLVALVVWVAFVLIIPRGGMMAAGQIVPVPRVAEIEGRRDGFAKDAWKKHYDAMEKRWEEDRRRAADSGLDPNSDEAMWARMQREDSLYKQVEQRIADYEVRLLDDLRRRRDLQQRLGLTLSRFSPASAYQLAAMNLAATDVGLKSRYEDAMSAYRDDWSAFVEKRRAETNDRGGMVTVEVSSETGVQIGTGSDAQIDISDMPRFRPPVPHLAEVLAPLLPDLGILAIGTLLIFMGAFIAFLRYDVR
jgi:ABC-type transport system involved in multi-copper enzyme maturation permease subunit